jgi:S-adenosyl methyltransferase
VRVRSWFSPGNRNHHRLPAHLIISVGSGSQSEAENFTSAYTAARVYVHSPEEIASFFDGLDVVPPGVVAVRRWYGDDPAPNLKPRTATFLGGVARKP